MNFLHKPSRAGIGVNLVILAFNALLIGALWVAVLEIVSNDRRETFQAAIDRNDNLAIAFEEYAQHILDNADQFLKLLIRQHSRIGGKVDLDQYVADHTLDNMAYADIALANERGEVSATAYHWRSGGKISMADREHFRVHLKADTSAMFIGKPVTDRISGRSVVPLTRRINRPDGSFRGVAMVLIEHSRFTSVLQDAKMRQLDILSLVGMDGITRARLRGNIPTAGEDISKSPLFAEQARRPVGNYAARGQVDGIQRLFSYRTLKDYLLVATVGTAEADVLAPHIRRRQEYFWTAGIASTLITGFTVLLIGALSGQSRAAARLARSRARFLATFNQAAVGIAHSDLDGYCLETNQKLCDITGYSREELLGRKFIDITHPDDIAASIEFRKRAVAIRDPIQSLQREKRYVRKDGSIVWCLLTTSAVHDDAGNIDYLAAIIQDITDRKNAEKRTADLLQYAQTLLDTSPIAIVTYKASGEGVSANPALARILGVALEQAQQQNFRQIEAWKKTGLLAVADRALDSNTPQETEIHTTSSFGREIWLHCWLIPFRFFDEPHLLCFFEDIRERKLAESALRDYAERMRQMSQRLSVVEENERRNIHRELHDQIGAGLSALKLDLSLIGSMLDAEVEKTIGIRLQRAQQLTGETIARIRDVMGELRPPALDDFGLLAALRTHAQPFAARLGIPVHVNGDEIEPRLAITTETALFRITQEALTNIAKHARARQVAITLDSNPDRVTLVIADDGDGFDAGQGNPRPESWGLLTMRERAQAIGADLRIESSPGKGTRVIVEVSRTTE